MRGVHAHNRPVERAAAGERCALNLAGSFPDGARAGRGDWVVAPELHVPTSRIDVALTRVARRAGAAARRAAGASPSRHRGRRRAGSRCSAAASIAPGDSGLRAARPRPPDRRAVGRPGGAARPRARGTPWPAAACSTRRRRAAAAPGPSASRARRRCASPTPASRSTRLVALAGVVELAPFALARNLAAERARGGGRRASCASAPRARRWSRRPRTAGAARRRDRRAARANSTARSRRRSGPTRGRAATGSARRGARAGARRGARGAGRRRPGRARRRGAAPARAPAAPRPARTSGCGSASSRCSRPAICARRGCANWPRRWASSRSR